MLTLFSLLGSQDYKNIVCNFGFVTALYRAEFVCSLTTNAVSNEVREAIGNKSIYPLLSYFFDKYHGFCFPKSCLQLRELYLLRMAALQVGLEVNVQYIKLNI
jgi:hypothetical protein